MNKEFWHNKRVFLTGHTGFKGSWLSLWLQSCNAQVTGYALAPHTKPNLFEGANITDKIISINGDICNLNNLTKSLIDSKSEIVIHMAAQPIVRDSYIDPVKTFQTNFIGTVNMLEACRNSKYVKAVLIVTSDKCYETNEFSRACKEDDPMGGFDPYSSSKGCCELAASAYRRSFALNVATARAGNVIGGGDWSKDRLLPDIVRAIDNKKEIIIRNPNAIRPWQHVLDCLNGYLILTQALYEKRTAEAFNFGPEISDAKSVSWILERYSYYYGKSLNIIIQDDPSLYEVHYLSLDSSKAKSVLGWRPIWNIEKAVEMTAAWNKGRINGKAWDQLCLEQIELFSQEYLL